MSRYFTVHRAWTSLFAVLAAVVAVVMALNGAAPAAHAESGRRVCKYIERVSTQVTIPRNALIHPIAGSTVDSYTVPANLYVGIDYKKDGACPTIEDPYNIAGNANNTVRLSYRQPVPKDQCEDWFRTINVTGNYLGTLSKEDPPMGIVALNPELIDVCTAMADDTVYEFYVVSQKISFIDGTVFNPGDFVSNERYNARD